jgi:hypothetical protein
MSVGRLDHIALEVADLDRFIEQLEATGGMRLLRRGTAKRTGQRLAMVGDQMGMKLELIENPQTAVPHYLHIAFRSGDVRGALAGLVAAGWRHERGPFPLEEAKAESGLVSDGKGFEVQVLSYAPDSPDIVEWENEA